MPHYSTIVGRHQGDPFIEILVGGQPFGDEFGFDAHFRFGVVKAKMLLTFREVIEVFAATNGNRPAAGESFKCLRGSIGRDTTCTVYPEFGRPGKRIQRPYLEFTSFAARIGIGVTKADAVTATIRDIIDFVRRYG